MFLIWSILREILPQGIVSEDKILFVFEPIKKHCTEKIVTDADFFAIKELETTRIFNVLVFKCC